MRLVRGLSRICAAPKRTRLRDGRTLRQSAADWLQGYRAREASDEEADQMRDHVATARAVIQAPPSKVWQALTDPDLIQRYMFGSRVETDWQPGSPITWKGEYDGKSYEDKGEILEVVGGRRLRLTHFSPLSGEEDAPENYHTLLYELEEHDGQTRISLSQDNNPSEEAAEHSRGNWEKMLSGLKEVVEAHSS
jgi:uncharacterized protein YndB with AHSA1/START domain